MDKQKRAEIKLAYKQTHKPMGVYQVKNNVNGKILVGSSMNLDGIMNRHQFGLNMQVHVNKKLQEDWNQYGEDNFTFEVLEFIKPEEEVVTSNEVLRKYQEQLRKLEEAWLETLQPYDNDGYNTRKRS